MVDTGFRVPGIERARIAQPLAIDPATKTPNEVLDVTVAPLNDSSGAGTVSTAVASSVRRRSGR